MQSLSKRHSNSLEHLESFEISKLVLKIHSTRSRSYNAELR